MAAIAQAMARTVFLMASALALAVTASVATAAPAVDTALRGRAVEALRQVFRTEPRWVKVHAAEALLALDYDNEEVSALFAAELERDGNTLEYRIGIRRVLVRAATDPADRQRRIDEIRAIFLDPTASDRLHAAETLGKLGYVLRPEGDEEFERVAMARVATSRRATQASVSESRLQAEVAGELQRADPAPLAEAPLQLQPEGRNSGRDAGGSSRDGRADARSGVAADGRLAVGAAWILANSAPVKGQPRLVELLGAEDPAVRGFAAYALGWQAALEPGIAAQVVAAAGKEPADSPARIHMVCTAYRCADSAARPALKMAVVEYAEKGTNPERYQAGLALAEHGDAVDLPLFTALLEHENADVRIGAATAILRLDRRNPVRLQFLDWAVVALYAFGMLGVGWYYARRTATQDDYLLGGRAMKPWAVGLSLFATLFSTISYLAIPGEMIKHGPMIMSQLVAYPVIVLIVGWLLIPHFMRLKVTSAYEVLELRLGVSVRLLGSLLFLLLRLLWMAVIIYATTSVVLVPLMGLSPKATPYVGAALGVITVIYTSMGGLRAVVYTDVAQTIIMFAGAILTMVLISVHLGGVATWWPTVWAPTWDPPVVWFDPKARVTLASACLATLVWYTCTAGSDQMAIQRYLATRDVKAARRMFTISMVSGGLIMAFLAVLGFALLAYFRANPHLIADGQSLATSADRLFPRFIVAGVPAGLSGLFIAGLLAAAMSSLSSGVNSSCSVLTVDLVERFWAGRCGDTVRLAKLTSWLVGATVVALSFAVVLVKGNLLEITYKVVNLLVTPLFILFAMALFVPWATAFGTILGTLVSAAVAIGIAFYGWLGLSFIWIMPASLAAGVLVGMLASLLPIGAKARKPLAELVDATPKPEGGGDA